MNIYFSTLGCDKNTADSEYAGGILERAGHTIVKCPQEADAIIVNTCGFINDAKEQSIDRIFELVPYKEENHALLIVTGCLSQRYGKQLSKELPEVDIFLGVNDYANLPNILSSHKEGGRESYFSDYGRVYLETGHRKKTGPGYTAFLKIAEGCDNVCAYCIIPKIRGPYRSRSLEAVVEEAKALAAEGCRELILIAQDVTAYGEDLPGEHTLPKLLTKLCQIQDIRWIRLMYCYEERITDELISVMAQEEKICHYIDIPIQHCSDRILESMNRRSTKQSIQHTLAALRQAMPDIAIRTTLITGFPGETQEDFDELLQFVEHSRFERLGVFSYSREEGTMAAKMPGQVRSQTKERRKEELMRTQMELSLALNQQRIGQTLEVLVEEQSEDGSYMGRSRYDAPEIDNSVLFTSETPLHPGMFVPVTVTDAFDYDLVGRVSCAEESFKPLSGREHNYNEFTK